MATPTPADVRAITDCSNTLVSLLRHYDLSTNLIPTALGIKAHVTLIRETSLMLESILSQYSPDELNLIQVPIDSQITSERAGRLAEALGTDVPDHLPTDWKD